MGKFEFVEDGFEIQFDDLKKHAQIRLLEYIKPKEMPIAQALHIIEPVLVAGGVCKLLKRDVDVIVELALGERP